MKSRSYSGESASIEPITQGTFNSANTAKITAFRIIYWLPTLFILSRWQGNNGVIGGYAK